MTKLGLAMLALACSLTATSVCAQARVTITAPGERQRARIESPRMEALLCTTPCSLSLEPDTYRIVTNAPDIRTNEATIVVPREGVALRARATNPAEYTWGVLLSTVGAVFVAFAGGLVAMALASAP